MSALCIIPAKGSSTRLKRKNLLEIQGKPLVTIAVEKAIATGVFETVIVSTEDQEIASLSVSSGAHVPFLRRPELSRDPSTILDVVLDVLDYLGPNATSFKSLSIVLPTSPLMTVEDIRAAHSLYLKETSAAVMSVCETDAPPFNAWLKSSTGDLEPCFPDSPYQRTKSTECPTTYRSNGAIVICGVKALLKNRDYRSMRLVPYEMPKERSIDIDTFLDFKLAQMLMPERCSWW